VRFVWDSLPTLPPLRTDAPKLKVILKNLIGNAAKFTDRGSVRIGATASRTGVDLYVQDTGIGIDPTAQAIIFDAFRQVDNPLTRRHGGVGLGLYIVRRLAGELGGTVEVESTLGEGSTFRVLLPLE
jgi:signal transduction histidine kinase